jgi:hypothetical protein
MRRFCSDPRHLYALIAGIPGASEIDPMYQKARVTAGFIGILLAAIGGLVQADEVVDPVVETLQCISLARLDRTDVIDDRNILFYMRNDKIYLNQLPHRCSGLRFADSFSYRPTVSRLCSIDTITPLRDGPPGGFGMVGGVSCKLGKFRAITEDEVLILKEKDAPEAEIQDEPAEIEPIDEDAEAASAEIESVD